MPDSMQFDESTLRTEVRRRLTDGRLPNSAQPNLWAGSGNGQACSLCDRPIGAQQIEYEVQAQTDAAAVYRFHRICHQLWERECRG